jgi:chromosome segregation ATPase
MIIDEEWEQARDKQIADLRAELEAYKDKSISDAAELAQLKSSLKWHIEMVEILTNKSAQLRADLNECNRNYNSTYQHLSEKVIQLRLELAEAREAIDKAAHELGVPQPGYIAPVANAATVLRAYLAKYPEPK